MWAYYRNLRGTVKEIVKIQGKTIEYREIQKTDLPTLITLIGNREIALENARNKKNVRIRTTRTICLISQWKKVSPFGTIRLFCQPPCTLPAMCCNIG